MERVPMADRETVEVLDGFFMTLLAVGEEMSLQHVRMESGVEGRPHSHPHEQVGYVLRGERLFTVAPGGDTDDVTEGGEDVLVTGGDSYVIPGGEPHTAVNPGEGPMEAVEVFSPPRPNPEWYDGGKG